MEANQDEYPLEQSLKTLDDPDAEGRVERVMKAFGIKPARVPPPLSPPPPDTHTHDERTIGKSPTPEGDPYFRHGSRRSNRIKGIRAKKAGLEALLAPKSSSTAKPARISKISKPKQPAKPKP
jgi:hypothetical protein